ncbi:MAG: Fis family transcriptional regulator, partial [Syntrophaceae bacterium]|nr:Fis family transcriptional regulator [Syntrophaceae bacterium]
YLPPLRERKSDIPLLVNHFVSQFNSRYGKQVRGLDPKVLKLFNQYAWPGNVRELQHALEHAFVFVKGPIITTNHLPDLKEKRGYGAPSGPDRSTRQYLWEDEKIAIQDVLKKAEGRRDEAARVLGISRTSLWRKMKSHGLI